MQANRSKPDDFILVHLTRLCDLCGGDVLRLCCEHQINAEPDACVYCYTVSDNVRIHGAVVLLAVLLHFASGAVEDVGCVDR